MQRTSRAPPSSLPSLSDGNYRSCAILGGSVEVPADCGGRRGECGRGRPRETCGVRRQHVGDVRKQRSADLESGDSDGGRGREGEAFVHLCGEVGREKCVGSQTRKWRWSTRLTHRSRSRSRSRSTDWPSVLEQQRLRRGMDHVINYAFQACSSNEERQSLEAATNASVAQQWMQSNPQFTMSQQVPPYFTTTPSPQQTPLQPSVQQFTEEQRPVATASTGKKACKVKLQNFNVDEDTNLTKCWIGISTDAVVNTGQRKEGFWFRITQAYNAARGIQPQRSQKSLMNRWDYIKEYCMKFADFYTEILRINPSGMSDADKTTEALARYAAAMSKPFSLMHCWKYLKDEPKFHEACAGQSKTINLEDDCYGTPAAGSNQVDTGGDSSTPHSAGSKRPLGRDATKESRKKAASSSSSSEYISKMHDLWADRFSDMKDGQAEKNKYLAQMAALEKEKIDRQVDIEERRLALEARRLDWEERKDESRMLAEEERILSIDLDTCKPALRLFYKAQQEKILAKYSTPPS